MRSRRFRFIAVSLFVVLAGLGAKVAFTRVPAVRRGIHQVHGAYHVHSSRAGGRGTPNAIANAASQVGLDFVVLADHNVLSPESLAVHNGVLIIPATEESTGFGHVVSLGASRTLTAAEKRDKPLAGIRAAGGVPMIAHPFNLRAPFSDWDELDKAQGLEALSYDDLWREALRSPFSRGLVVGGLELPFNRRLAVSQLLRRPDGQLARWDALRKTRPLVQACAVDAHGWPDYASVLGFMSMYIDDLPSVHGPEDAPKILAALESGHSFCAIDAVAPAGGFSFHADAPGIPSLSEGDHGTAPNRLLKVTLPEAAEQLHAHIHFFRDGKQMLNVPGPLQLAAPGPGDYRVEVWVKLPGAFWRGPKVPWIISNPIRLE